MCPPMSFLVMRPWLKCVVTRPANSEEFLEITGVGQVKLERHGETFLDAIARDERVKVNSTVRGPLDADRCLGGYIAAAKDLLQIRSATRVLLQFDFVQPFP